MAIKHSALALALVVGGCLAVGPVFAQDSGTTIETVSTTVRSLGDRGKGGELRPSVQALSKAIENKQFDKATSDALALRRAFETLFDPAFKPRSFLQKEDVEAYQKENPADQIEWIDWGYFQSIHAQMYLAAQRRDFPAAVTFGQQLAVLAPVSAATLAELGYVQNQLKQSREALVSYQRAVDVARRYPSQKTLLAASLRGVGFTLIELNQLKEAKQTFEESLQIEPGNKVALNELEYIQSQLKP